MKIIPIGDIVNKIEARGYVCTVRDTEEFTEISCIRDSDESRINLLLSHDEDFVGMKIQRPPHYKEEYKVLNELKEAAEDTFPRDVEVRSWEHYVKEYNLEVESKDKDKPVQRKVPVLIKKLWHIL